MDRILRNLGVFRGQYIENQADSILQTVLENKTYKLIFLVFYIKSNDTKNIWPFLIGP